MSAPQEPAIQRTYPLSPSPNSELRKSQPLANSFGAPRTPQSPLRIGAHPAGSSTTQSHTMYDVNSSSVLAAEVKTTSPMAVDTNGMLDEGTLKRKHEGEETGEHKDKKVHLEDRKPSISDLHIDVGKIYQLCRTPHPPKQPDLSQDLFAMYGLDSAAAKVARFFPNGEKNGLRKTYKGKIKDLGIAGKFDVKVHDEEAPSSLMAMMREPELEWNVGQVHGKSLSEFYGKAAEKKVWPTAPPPVLNKAFTFNSGIIPAQMWDSSVLGLDAEKEKVGAMLKPGSMLGSQKTSISQSMGYRPPKAQELARPKRAIKKRVYDDSSFEGYGEGFVDDDMADGGYSTGDGEERGGKRRKKAAPNHNQYTSSRYSSYGPGSVGS